MPLYILSQESIAKKMKSPIEIPYVHSKRDQLDQRAIYGFIIYLACFPAFLLYVIWAYIPHEWLNSIGITYLPNKHWAITAPMSALVISIIGLLAYSWNNRSLMQPLTSIYQIRDKHSMCRVNDMVDKQDLKQLDVIQSTTSYTREEPIIPQLHDLDYRLVTNELYLKQHSNYFTH
ncbi:unnamed protein product [Trichobilharzia szidati]|nr:unnamed protein product [Trichobilharzia szidati]